LDMPDTWACQSPQVHYEPANLRRSRFSCLIHENLSNCGCLHLRPVEMERTGNTTQRLPPDAAQKCRSPQCENDCQPMDPNMPQPVSPPDLCAWCTLVMLQETDRQSAIRETWLEHEREQTHDNLMMELAMARSTARDQSPPHLRPTKPYSPPGLTLSGHAHPQVIARQHGDAEQLALATTLAMARWS
jgi:hypothetical protein